MDKPILLIFYNRPENVKSQISRLRKIRPTHLYLASDGPRTLADQALVTQSREECLKIDWPCEVHEFFHIDNLGIEESSTVAAAKAFKNHEGVLILEDDCLPREDIFDYIAACDSLFDGQDSVAMYASFNPLGAVKRSTDKIFVVRHSFMWGAFLKSSHFWEFTSKQTHGVRSLGDCLNHALSYKGFSMKLLKFRTHWDHRTKNYFDLQFDIFMRKKGWFSAISPESLIHYIGSGKSATHTKSAPKQFALPIQKSIDFNSDSLSQAPGDFITAAHGRRYILWWLKNRFGLEK